MKNELQSLEICNCPLQKNNMDQGFNETKQ